MIINSNINLDTFNKYLLEELNENIPYYKQIVEQLLKHKGKQLRPRLALLCARLGGELNTRSYKAAMVVEMLHTASLIHDDIVDDSAERRGVESVNYKWGNRIALFSGDIISLKALQLTLSNGDYDIFEIYGRAVEEIVKGELIQLRKTRRLNLDEEIYFEIIKAKTAAFFKAACESGACTTIQDKELVKRLGVFGENLGIAFQIKDDLFGFSTAITGKPNDNDLIERKMTLPVIHALNSCSTLKRRSLKKTIKGLKKNPVKIEFIKNIVLEAGGVDYAVTVMNSYRDKALEQLEVFPKNEITEELSELVHYSIDRKF